MVEADNRHEGMWGLRWIGQSNTKPAGRKIVRGDEKHDLVAKHLVLYTAGKLFFPFSFMYYTTYPACTALSI